MKTIVFTNNDESIDFEHAGFTNLDSTSAQLPVFCSEECL